MTFDVIICAGVLCYFNERRADSVCGWLARHLRRDGVLVVQNSPQFRHWDAYLKQHFVCLDEWICLMIGATSQCSPRERGPRE
jgi:chemotaxis methyl-accepting protein methylase